MITLYSYWRSTSSYRVRAVVNLKRIEYKIITVNLTKGQQQEPDFARLNPAQLVPTLVLDTGEVLTQSLAIIDYLDRAFPFAQLLPKGPVTRAKTLSVAQSIAMEIHPINNLRVIARFAEQFGASAEDKRKWMAHWISKGFAAIENELPKETEFAFGATPGLTDICIVAQFYNARRWGVQTDRFSRLSEIEQTCRAMPVFFKAAPEQQADAVIA